MLQTTNYALKKIELTDSPPDITVINPNWDTIDAELKEHDTAIAAHLADDVKHITSAERTTWNGKVSKTGDTITGTIRTTPDIPFFFKKAGKKTHALHKDDLGNLHIAPSASIDAEDIDWSKTIYFDTNGNFFVGGTNLKQSVSDGKINVRNAITGKGGTVADADGDGIPTHQELADGVNTLGSKAKGSGTTSTLTQGQSTTITINLPFTPSEFFVRQKSGGYGFNLITWVNGDTQNVNTTGLFFENLNVYTNQVTFSYRHNDGSQAAKALLYEWLAVK